MRMFWSLILLSFNLFAQVEVLESFDKKVYSPKGRGVSDLVFEIENEKILEELNEQKIFGNLKKVSFRFYWTAKPERLAVDVIGLPDGFKEIKENLKVGVVNLFEDVIPTPLERKFSNFNLKSKSKNNIEAKPKDSFDALNEHEIHFDNTSKLIEIVVKKPVGLMSSKFDYDRPSFSDGRWVLNSQETTVEEMGNKLSIKKRIVYQTVTSVGFPKEITIQTIQNSPAGKHERQETFKFLNYSVNKGDALKYFVNEVK